MVELSSLPTFTCGRAFENFWFLERAAGRELTDPDAVRRLAGMDPVKLTGLREWLRQSDDRDFAAVVIRNGWELRQRHGGEGGRSGEGIPADARSKPGSGGQLIAFVPSLDLVIARQTGSSGDWEYEEYLRRACAAVLERGVSPR